MPLLSGVILSNVYQDLLVLWAYSSRFYIDFWSFIWCDLSSFIFLFGNLIQGFYQIIILDFKFRFLILFCYSVRDLFYLLMNLNFHVHVDIVCACELLASIRYAPFHVACFTIGKWVLIAIIWDFKGRGLWIAKNQICKAKSTSWP